MRRAWLVAILANATTSHAVGPRSTELHIHHGPPPKHVAEAVLFFDYAVVGAMRTTLLFSSKQLGGDSPWLLSVLESAFGLGQVTGALFIGKLSDYHGRRALLAVCLACSACAYALSGVALSAGSVALLLASRLPSGISKQTTTTARAIICDATSQEERASALSTLYACCALGYAVGPVFGGMVTESGRAHQLAWYGALGYAAITPALVLVLDETLPVTPEETGTSQGHQPRKPSLVWRRPALVRSLLVTGLPEAALVMHTAVAQPLLCRSLGLSPNQVGRLSAAQGLSAAVLSLSLLPRLFRDGWLDERRALFFTNVALLVASACLACFPSPAVLWAMLPMFVISVSLQRAASTSLVSKAAPSHARGEALGALDAISSLCRIVVPIIAAALASTRGGVRMPYAAMAALGGLGLLAWMLQGRAMLSASGEKQC